MTYASVGWRLPLDGFTRSDQRDSAELLPGREPERVAKEDRRRAPCVTARRVGTRRAARDSARAARTIGKDSAATPSPDSRATGRSDGSDAWCRRDSGDGVRHSRSSTFRAMRRSSSSMACFDLRAPPLVGRRPASWRSSSVRASLNDSSARTCSGSRIVSRRRAACARAPALPCAPECALRVDQSFAGITHQSSRPRHEVSHYKMTRREPHGRESIRWRRFIQPCASGSRRAFERRHAPQALGWPAIARGESTLILAPTGSGKTLAAFLWCLDRLMFAPAAGQSRRAAACSTCRRSRRWRSTSSATCARRSPASRRSPTAAAIAFVDAGDRHPHRRHAAAERARFQREPADILITTPESLYLLLTSNAREALRSIDTVIVDEIHALVPTKRGAHLALSIERLAALLRAPAAADRPVRDAAAARRGGAVSRRRRARSRTVRGAGVRRTAGARRAARARRNAVPHGRRDGAARRDRRRVHRRTGPVHYRPVTIVDAGHEEGAEADASKCRSRTWRG